MDSNTFFTSPLEKLPPQYASRYFEQIIDRITSDILSGQLKEGNALPSERELAGLLDVSRVPVREAFKILVFCGVLEPQTGGGMVIKSLAHAQLLSQIRNMIFPNKNYYSREELFEFRYLFEPFAAFLAAQRRTEEDLKVMRLSIDNMRRDVAAKIIPIGSQSFHFYVVIASKNELLKDLYNYLYIIMEESRRRTLYDMDWLSRGADMHWKIYESIRDRDSEKAKTLMTEHLHVTEDHWR